MTLSEVFGHRAVDARGVSVAVGPVEVVGGDLDVGLTEKEVGINSEVGEVFALQVF